MGSRRAFEGTGHGCRLCTFRIDTAPALLFPVLERGSTASSKWLAVRVHGFGLVTVTFRSEVPGACRLDIVVCECLSRPLLGTGLRR